MIKKIGIGILGLIIGIIIGYYLESFFRNTIQDIFRLTTSDKIRFVGKNISIFSDRTFTYIIGLGISIFLLANWNLNPSLILKNLIRCLLIFGISIFGISAIYANLKVIECIACDDGILKIHWNGINYGLIIMASVIISTVPSIITLIKRKNASVQHR